MALGRCLGVGASRAGPPSWRLCGKSGEDDGGRAGPRRPARGARRSDVLARSQRRELPGRELGAGRRGAPDLLAIYGFARLVDELGDALEGDRLAALDWVEAELDRAFRGDATHPVLVSRCSRCSARTRCRASRSCA